MASVNKAIILGNLGRDPEMRYLPSGEAVANLAIATTEKFKDKQGQQQEATEWHKVSFFGKVAEVCGTYLKKGSQVYVEGSIRTRKYEKDGQERYSTEIRGDRMQMLGGKQDDDSRAQPAAPQRAPSGAMNGGIQPATGSGFDDLGDDVPF